MGGLVSSYLPCMSFDTWNAVDHYLCGHLAPPDDILEAALRSSQEAGLPAIQVAPNQGKLLNLWARSMRATRILEVGTLGAYSTIWLARALGEGGQMVSLELEAKHAEVARTNLSRAGLADKVEVRCGPAADLLRQMIEQGEPAFDLIFVDADKASIDTYFQLSLALSRPGTVLVFDNVVRHGAILSENDPDPNVQGVRRLYQRLAAEPRVDATAIQTVGCKGYDGLAMALVLE